MTKELKLKKKNCSEMLNAIQEHNVNAATHFPFQDQGCKVFSIGYCII